MACWIIRVKVLLSHHPCCHPVAQIPKASGGKLNVKQARDSEYRRTDRRSVIAINQENLVCSDTVGGINADQQKTLNCKCLDERYLIIILFKMLLLLLILLCVLLRHLGHASASWNDVIASVAIYVFI